MAISHSLVFLVLFVVSSTLATKSSSAPPKALFLPVTKDPKTNQYVTQILQRTPLVPVKLAIDLGAPNTWVDCENGFKSSTYKFGKCGSLQCKMAKPTECLDETHCLNTTVRPGCNKNACTLHIHNPLGGSIALSEVAQDVISVQSTNGKNPTSFVTIPEFLFGCDNVHADAHSQSLSPSLGEGVKGMAGFGKTKVSIPSQFSSAFKLRKKFSMCLGSSKGAMFFGDAPVLLLPPPGIDISSRLTYTPLVKNRRSMGMSSMEPDIRTLYYLGVTSIKIEGKEVPFNKTLLSFDEGGRRGVKISTTDPYTKLESSIYKAFTNAFIKATSNIPRVKPVKPFKVCYNSKHIPNTRIGPGVPNIDLNLMNNVTWTIYGANSMVHVSRDVMCLAFVERDWYLEEYAIVIGSHQLENNFMEFDLQKSRLGFFSSILLQRTHCGNFNFTSTA